MSKVLLVNTLAYPNYPNLGLGYIGAYLKSFGHNIRIFDIIRGEQEYEDTLTMFKPDFIGFNSFTSAEDQLKLLIDTARDLTDATVIVGGHHANSLPLQTFEKVKPDILVLGEGELKMLEIVDGKTPINEMEGILAYSNNRPYRSYNTTFIEDLDTLPFPDRRMMNASDYHGDWTYKRKPFTTIITGRGCPFNCSFCATRLMWGRRVRRRSIRNVMEEIEELLAQGWKEFYIIDDTFTITKKYVLEFCREIRERNLDFTWKTLSRVDTLDEEMAIEMKKAGCHTLLMGVESGNQETLNFLNKGTALQKIRNAFKICDTVGLLTNAFLIYNLPNERKEDLMRTLEFVKEINPTWIYLSNLIPFPNTDIEIYLKQNGVKIDESYGQDKIAYSYMKDMSPEEIEKLVFSFVFEFFARLSYLPKSFAYGWHGFNQWIWTVQHSGSKAGYKVAKLFRLLERTREYGKWFLKKIGLR